MKTMIILVSVLASQISFADMRNSKYEVVHQQSIEESVVQACGIAGVLTQESSDQQLVSVDNGVNDIYFTTVLKVSTKMDQFSGENTVVVKSVLTDAYNHETKNWGVYSVESVVCN